MCVQDIMVVSEEEIEKLKKLERTERGTYFNLTKIKYIHCTVYCKVRVELGGGVVSMRASVQKYPRSSRAKM